MRQVYVNSGEVVVQGPKTQNVAGGGTCSFTHLLSRSLPQWDRQDKISLLVCEESVLFLLGLLPEARAILIGLSSPLFFSRWPASHVIFANPCGFQRPNAAVALSYNETRRRSAKKARHGRS